MQLKVEYLVRDDEFIIKNYNNAKAFASFFPSLAGIWGKPMWVFYVNRGQAISCMGTRDKNGAITEFIAANKAYRLTPTHGFRTFIKTGDRVYEPFRSQMQKSEASPEQRMHITSYLLKLAEKNEAEGFEVIVDYFTLPDETIPGLVRKLTIRNMAREKREIECLDGLPLVHPYGTNDYLLKNMSRLAEGWFSGVEFSGRFKVPVYKLRVEPEDKPEIFEIHAGNFYGGYSLQNGKVSCPAYIIDPDIIFGERKDLIDPVGFFSKDFRNIPSETSKNKTPSAMGYFRTALGPDESVTYYSLVGHVLRISDTDSIFQQFSKPGYCEEKLRENRELIQSIGNLILSKSSSNELDNYTQQTFIDNLLRGGLPITIGGKKSGKNVYVYSRIHGDMEREYNNFVILPEYFSQGNGSYRDVNQNRRNDIFFNPGVKDEPIIYFMSLIQTDGFNPLRIMGSKFKVTGKQALLKLFRKEDRSKIQKFIGEPFSLGSFFNFIEKERIKQTGTRENLLNVLAVSSEKLDYADVGECYWSDHWHYNIDLIESYLSLFPDERENLFLKKKVFTFYDNPKVVEPRSRKYVLFHGKPRQLKSVTVNPEKVKMIESRKAYPHIVRTQYGKGGIYRTTLMAKLISLTANKYASLDPEGIGLEMESEKPNWCDALNGLPGLFGSSTSESLELKRLILFILNSLEQMAVKDNTEIRTAREIVDLLVQLKKATLKNQDDQFKFWDETHTLKEQYRVRTMMGLSGAESGLKAGDLKGILELFLKKVEQGLARAFDSRSGVINTNFEHLVEKYKILKEGKNHYNLACIKPLRFRQVPLKLFLEGPVHYLRICRDRDEARKFHAKVMVSGLFDKKLNMLKVNAPLDDTSINIGRIKIFTPGWLENESVWLHMEYKYLLELLRNGLTDEFYRSMKNMLVPFMDPHVYGRSIFENVSFIASSAHPEKKIQGQGFVARLSGSTAEYISMWIAMTSGLTPFSLKDKKLYLEFKPRLAGWLFTKRPEKVRIWHDHDRTEDYLLEENSFLFKFLGCMTIVYHNPKRKDTFGPGPVRVQSIQLVYSDKKKVVIKSPVLPPPYSLQVREGKVDKLLIELG
ncbi:MAG: hypothetical protein PHF84_05935 [bacterium]|nr:hypothetical protein [bacterium]